MNYFEELNNLVSKYKDLLHDHKIPIDMTTKEQYELKGYDMALKRVVIDLNRIIKMDKEAMEQADKYLYTE